MSASPTDSKDLEQNRFERTYQRAKRHRWLLVVFLIAFLLAVEALSLRKLYLDAKSDTTDISWHFFTEDYPLSKLALGNAGWARERFRTKHYIGNVTPEIGTIATLYKVDSVLGWRNVPGIVATHYGKYLYVHNEQGFSSSGSDDFHYDRQKPNDVYRIIVIGGSTVYGQGAPEPAENLPARLSQVIGASIDGKRIEVINAGVGGYTSRQEALFLEMELLDYAPDLLIVYDGWNDQSYLNAILNKSPDATLLKTTAQLRQEQRLESTYSLKGSLQIFVGQCLVALRTMFLQSGAATLLHRTTAIALRSAKGAAGDAPVPTYHVQSVIHYRKNLETMLNAARSRGVRIGVFLQPILGIGTKILTPQDLLFLSRIDDARARQQFFAEASAMFEELAAKYRPDSDQACVRDLSRAFDGYGTAVYADSGHLNAAGNYLVATWIKDRLEACGLLPKAL